MRTSAEGAYLPTFLIFTGGGAGGVGLTGKPKETPIWGLGVGRPHTTIAGLIPPFFALSPPPLVTKVLYTSISKVLDNEGKKESVL